MNYRIEQYDEVSSTNSVVKERIDAGEAEGLVVIARTQNGGYGRRGNAWSSPEGGLYASFLLRPNVGVIDFQTLPHACAIAARRTIAGFLGEAHSDCVKIKWPNDIVYVENESSQVLNPKDSSMLDSASENSRENTGYGFKKLCGISVEQRNGAVCVGIGINVLAPNTDNSKLFETISCSLDSKDKSRSKNIPVYMENLIDGNERIDVQEVAEALLETFASVYSVWERTLLSELKGEYMQHFALSGFKARIDESASSAIECEVLGINEQGNLEVIPFGETGIKTIVAGTVRAL